MDAIKMELNDNVMENVSGGTALDHDTGNYIWYTVVSGDDLSKIGLRFNCTWQIIYKLNRSTIGSNANRINPGICLKIPQ